MKFTKMQWAITIVIAILSISLIAMVITFHSEMNTNNSKVEILKNEKAEAEAKANKKSDIEMLEFYAKENAYFAKDRLKEIAEYKEEITKLEWLYETEVLTQRCYESQIDRKINWLEYNLEYCKDESNLEQFRSKKY